MGYSDEQNIKIVYYLGMIELIFSLFILLIYSTHKIPLVIQREKIKLNENK